MTKAPLALVVCLIAFAVATSTDAAPTRLQAIADAITELDVERARGLLADVKADTPAVALERGRLALYTGDCDAASAILSAPSLSAEGDATAMLELAKSCARATAGSLVVERKDLGIWVRLQDEGDRALLPFFFDVASRARAVVERDLGVELPRPLRVDLVRDLFSLSAVTGLPVAAAETTGTVAVARWGRVTIISPRATPLGYPWEDTLAHELTHLALSRASRDRAPLWLQEGVAKREESRWRERRPLDDTPPLERVARNALVSGRSVGVDKLGPSIAMLPTPEAASIAFAEVTSFVDFWIGENGDPALQLLLLDLKGTASDDPNAALRSVTGYDFPTWVRRWQDHLLKLPEQVTATAREEPKAKPLASADAARRLRLSDLLWADGHAAGAAAMLEPFSGRSGEAAVRWRLARARLALGQLDAAAGQLGKLSDLDVVHGAWAALNGRILKQRGGSAEAEAQFGLGVSVDPYSVDVACEGHSAVENTAPAPTHPSRRDLCIEARRLPRD